ncbi:type IV pilin-like G/H family protein [Pseudanabaena sp. BC1403]|uniref:type IV pilin-like G/H family protein n=1 Tax=Pseudanabaena sp. BC1403 TaxID=2043171 RepID=UPI000CD8BAE5|nr:type IV pilin-like G/H family protein [Pseudanabaena sp. BC1403]
MDNTNEHTEVIPKTLGHRRFLWALVGVIPLGVGLCFVQVPISCACGNRAPYITDDFVRAQQAYFEEHKKFGKSYEDLKILGALLTTTVRYEYSFEVEQDRAFIYATPQVVPNDFFRLGLTTAKIPGVVSAVIYDAKQKATVKVTCLAEDSTSGRPPKPVFDGKDLICGAGFRKYL